MEGRCGRNVIQKQVSGNRQLETGIGPKNKFFPLFLLFLQNICSGGPEIFRTG